MHYELGRVHEQMGVFDMAADHYQKVLEIGLPTAGALYEMARSSCAMDSKNRMPCSARCRSGGSGFSTIRTMWKASA